MRDNYQLIAATVVIVLIVLVLTGCTTNTLKVLDGATHACGNLHVEGYITDTQGEVVVVKAPADWTPEQVKEFCNGSD